MGEVPRSAPSSMYAAAAKAAMSIFQTAPPPTESRSESHRHRRYRSVDSSSQRKHDPNNTGSKSIDRGGDSDARGCTVACEKKQRAFEEDLQDFQDALSLRTEELEALRAEHDKWKNVAQNVRGAYRKTGEELAQQKKETKQAYEIISNIIEKSLRPYATKYNIVPEQWTEEALYAVLELQGKSAADADDWQKQVHSLQKELLETVGKAQSSSDEQFAHDFRVVVGLAKTLSRTPGITDDLDIQKLLASGELQQDVSIRHWKGRAMKKLLVEAWVWSMLIKMVFRTPFAMIGPDCDSLNKTWQNIYGNKHCHDWPSPKLRSEIWRYTTMESMMEIVSQDVITTGNTKYATKQLDKAVENFRQHVISYIQMGLGISSSSAAAQQVLSIINKAFGLALQMSVQKFRLQITYPKVGSNFDEDTMRFQNSEEEDHQARVAFVVNPGLTKWGDTHGKNFEHRYDIVPALVHLEAPVQDAEQVDVDCSKKKDCGMTYAAIASNGSRVESDR
ncbi:hypothetical protein NX059_007726 [Plenodomus lindquistii]|nr:hypothetical protein NX059_007726 [Plenodomus lindquistii]